MFDRSRVLLAAPLLGLLVLTSGCSSSASDDDDSDAEEISVADANAALEIAPSDIWAQPLPQSEMKMSVTLDGKRVHTDDYPIAKVMMRDAGRYQIHLEAPMHDPADVVIDYDGSADPRGAKVVSAPQGTGVSLGHATHSYSGRPLPAHNLFIGLRHQWFSAQGRPARRGNDVKLMMDGQESWTNVSKTIQSARSSVHMSTWWWQSESELIRDLDPTLSTDQRWGNTIMGSLEASPATKRIMVGQFWGQDSILSWISTDSKLRKYADTPNDNFEFMGQGNETRGSFDFQVKPFNFGDRVRSLRAESKGESFDNEAPIQSTVPGHHVDLSAHMPFLTDWADGLLEAGSYHQKFAIVDRSTAFVGGMNLRPNDWDTSQHAVYDPRRMKFDANMKDRMDVAGKLRATDNPPRKDYMVRIAGPSAQDVEDVFHERWEYLRSQGVKYAQNNSDYDVKRDIAPLPQGGTQLQVTATLPAPFNENAIAETWFNAVRNAKHYIYVEDQYFRVPMLDDVIVKRMQDVPDLKLIVITMDVSKSDPACAWSRNEYGRFRQAFPDRAFFFRLRSFDGGGVPESSFADIDTHSKMLMVDDTFLSVGSANKNNRGIIYEGELNVAIADQAFVTDARRRIVWNLLGSPATMPEDWTAALAAEAMQNDQTYSTWAANKASAPSLSTTGFVYSLVYPRLDDCVLASVGPDRT